MVNISKSSQLSRKLVRRSGLWRQYCRGSIGTLKVLELLCKLQTGSKLDRDKYKDRQRGGSLGPRWSQAYLRIAVSLSPRVSYGMWAMGFHIRMPRRLFVNVPFASSPTILSLSPRWVVTPCPLFLPHLPPIPTLPPFSTLLWRIIIVRLSKT